MYHIYKCLVITGILFFVFSVESKGQTFDDIQKQYSNQFDNFVKEKTTEFDSFVDKIDKEFSDHLRNAWEQFDLLQGKKTPQDKPKLDSIPKVDPVKVKNVVDELKIENANSTESKEVYEKPHIPQIQKQEDQNFATNDATIKYYGTDIPFKYDKNINAQLPAKITEAAIADFWDKMTKTNHFSLVNLCLDYKTKLNLNDYAYYILLSKMSAGIYPNSPNEANLLTWFLLLKSGYKAKVGYNEDKIYIMLASESVIYNRSYFNFDGVNYYLMAKNAQTVYSYRQDYAAAKQAVDINLKTPINLAQKIVIRKVAVEYDNKKYEFLLRYNSNLTDFYKDYPQTDIKIFFDAAVSSITKVSLIENLKPLIKDKNELDAANFLLNFVQNGFAYETDIEQFKEEKFFFPEETLYYPFCDCDDRAVMYAYLVKELLGLKVVGLAYPGHIATAVRFSGDYGLDFFNYNGEKYVIADPTYVNAPIGMCMPRFVGTKGKVIELENTQNRKTKSDKIWDSAMNAGAYPGGNGENIVYDASENAYITGFFKGEISLGTVKLKSVNERSDAFIAKFDKTGNVLWAKTLASEGADIANAINIDKSGNCYISGSYNKPLKVDGKELQSNGVKDVFVAKYSTNGDLTWLSRMDISNPDLGKDHIYVSRFEAGTGEHKSTILFNETGNFSDYGIAFDNDGNCFVTVAFSAADGGAVTESYNFNENFSFVNSWMAANKELVGGGYVSPIAGLFAFIKTLRVSGISATGAEITQALDKQNPNLKKLAPVSYRSIANIEKIENSGGIITIATKGGANLQFDEIIIKNNAKMKVTTYTGGNAQINILSGVNFGKSLTTFDLNFVRLDKESGNLIFDYDADHSQKQLNLKKDLLK